MRFNAFHIVNMQYNITGYPTSYPYTEYLDLPTDEELGVDLANFCHDEARNLKDGRSK